MITNLSLYGCHCWRVGNVVYSIEYKIPFVELSVHLYSLKDTEINVLILRLLFVTNLFQINCPHCFLLASWISHYWWCQLLFGVRVQISVDTAKKCCRSWFLSLLGKFGSFEKFGQDVEQQASSLDLQALVILYEDTQTVSPWVYIANSCPFRLSAQQELPPTADSSFCACVSSLMPLEIWAVIAYYLWLLWVSPAITRFQNSLYLFAAKLCGHSYCFVLIPWYTVCCVHWH